MHSVTSNAVARSVANLEHFCLRSWNNPAFVDLSEYFDNIGYSPYGGVVLYVSCYNIDNVGFYLINCSTHGGVYTHLLAGTNNRSFSFNPNTKVLTWTNLVSQQASNHFTLLG